MKRDEWAERYELLCDREDLAGAVTAADKIRGGYYRTRSIRSGTLLEVQCYPMPARGVKKELKKVRPTEEAQRKLNDKNAQRRLIRLAECNFGEEDYYFTGTIEGELPTVEGTQKIMRAFLRRWKRAREKLGLKSHKYIYVIEGHDDGDRKKRVHVHAILEGGLDRKVVKAMWDCGRARCDELDKSGKDGLIPLARYLSKDPRGKRRWSASKGLKQPVVRTAERKVTAKKAMRIAEDSAGRAAALEKLYPGYELVEMEVRSNPYIAGVYIYAVMRKTE